MNQLFVEAFECAHKLNISGGTLLEFGVGWGSTYLFQVNKILELYHNDILIGFDSFCGLPEEDSNVWRPERHKKGSFAYPKEYVLNIIQPITYPNDKRFMLVEGFYENSLTKTLQQTVKNISDNNIIFINIDVDLYISTLQVLDFVLPFLKKDVIIYWDDWKDPNDKHDEPWGEHRAWDEWINKHQEIKYTTCNVNKYNQRYMKIL